MHWPHDASSGDFRDSACARDAIPPLAQAATQLGAHCVLFKSPELFSPSVANRDALRRFFSEVVTAETLPCDRVWLPGGLWEIRTALSLARDLGITLAFDPTVRAPEDPASVHYDLEAPSLYFRVENAGRTGTMRPEAIEDLAALIEHYDGTDLTIAFASPQRWADAQNLKKSLSQLEPDLASEDEG